MTMIVVFQTIMPAYLFFSALKWLKTFTVKYSDDNAPISL